MKKLIIIIAIIISLFNSCSDQIKDYEQEVYNDILSSLINIDNFYKPAPPPVHAEKKQEEKRHEISWSRFTQGHVLRLLFKRYRQEMLSLQVERNGLF